MLIIEVVVCSDVQLDCIILRGVYNIVIHVREGRLLLTPFNMIQYNTTTHNELKNKHKVELFNF